MKNQGKKPYYGKSKRCRSKLSRSILYVSNWQDAVSANEQKHEMPGSIGRVLVQPGFDVLPYWPGGANGWYGLACRRRAGEPKKATGEEK